MAYGESKMMIMAYLVCVIVHCAVFPMSWCQHINTIRCHQCSLSSTSVCRFSSSWSS